MRLVLGTPWGDVAGFAGGQIASFVIGGGLTWIAARSVSKLRARNMWRLTDAESLAVVVSDIGAMDTGEYARQATGIGVSRALAVIAPSLAKGYRKVNLEKVYLASELPGEALEGDLIVLGGPKYNAIARQVLDDRSLGLPVRFVGSCIEVEMNGTHIECDSVVSGKVITQDVGLILSVPNPFCGEKDRRLVILAGSHTYGQVAAARYFVDHYRGLRRQRGVGTVEVVRSHIERGHVLPATSEYVKVLERFPIRS